MQSKQLELYLNDLLDVGRFQDYCPNGLQVQGKPEILRIVTGVTASLALLDEAAAWGADAVLVHHGYFWRGEDPRVIGQKHARLRRLLVADINLFSFHLPLDAHPELGNNAQLGEVLGLGPAAGFQHFGKDNLACYLDLPEAGEGALTLQALAARLEERLERAPTVVGDPARPLRRLAWCTGAAQGWLDEAVALGADAYLSGEISEPTTHLAREAGVAYIAAGHHTTERYGISALGRHLAVKFGLEHRFIDIPNPA
ncbi:MAG: Nif3-like dinuclear metal center hexameric protein [Candidatus Protistobacter heckmanni]|nr:Nif3-like dinuclear metal center hexameric protein [Candidatus Protistobacter heckmanni]